jgi:hypothetical protein
MRKYYPEVANEQVEFGIFKAEDTVARSLRMYRKFFYLCIIFIFTVTYLSVLPAHTTYIMTYMTHTFANIDSQNVNLSNLQHFCV